ncbi:disulfide bond formation protein B [Luminiphilus syltensis NOR5-1B]|uniref:Disulfide bond formation protein B n=1 Tax=Luminiphilus syltensis NOR5-1B TaxID=565045 RepID=B8KST8_9GAMM|nr:disulfide bond formation protein B [Luminiphilus syltensis]EED34937.1 disulfide bond formation protein B [Luminiphilus syltensis NOR5-1B]
MIGGISNRVLLGGVALICASAMGFALYLQYVVGLSVCPLCLTQRVFIIGTGIVAFLGFVHGPAMLGQRVYGGIALLFSGIGCGFAARHVWLQHLPPEEVPACGPPLAYMLETLPFSETLTLLLTGDGNCAEVVWSLFGLSIPELTLGLFIALIVVLTTIIARAR